MGFQPVIPFGGMAGWAFLQRTQPAQEAAFEATPAIQRDTDYFAAKIGNIARAEDLVSDFRLLKVALGAFGLDDDLPNKAFIQKVLSEGSLDPESFANRLVDKRYLALTEAFGFDLAPPNTGRSDFAADIVGRFTTRQFEIAVGEQNPDLRLAMAIERDLGEIAGSANTDDGKWFAVMGNEPLRKVFETALGLPSSVGALDLDRQVGLFRSRTEAVYGSGEVSAFAAPEKQTALTELFLARAQISGNAGSMSSGSIALALLQTI